MQPRDEAAERALVVLGVEPHARRVRLLDERGRADDGAESEEERREEGAAHNLTERIRIGRASRQGAMHAKYRPVHGPVSVLSVLMAVTHFPFPLRLQV